MPEIAGTGENWFISHHQQDYIEVLEVALPSNRRVRLEYIDGGKNVVLKTLVRHKDEMEKWEAIAEFEHGDLSGVASLFFKVGDMAYDGDEEGIRTRAWRPWHWLRRLMTGKDRRRGDDGGIIDEDRDDPFAGLGSSDRRSAGDVAGQGDDGVPADAGGGGGDPRDERAPSVDGPKAQ